MTLPLVYYPDPLLNQLSKKVSDVIRVQKLCSDMIETMQAENGIGISAVQVGELLRVAIIHKDADKELKDHLVVINPKIWIISQIWK